MLIIITAKYGGGRFNLESYWNFYSKEKSIEFKPFRFDEIFRYERGRRYKKADHTSGDIPYISSSAFNNGIDNFVNPPRYMKIYKNKLTLANSGSVGSCFYHTYNIIL